MQFIQFYSFSPYQKRILFIFLLSTTNLKIVLLSYLLDYGNAKKLLLYFIFTFFLLNIKASGFYFTINIRKKQEKIIFSLSLSIPISIEIATMPLPLPIIFLYKLLPIITLSQKHYTPALPLSSYTSQTTRTKSQQPTKLSLSLYQEKSHNSTMEELKQRGKHREHQKISI